MVFLHCFTCTNNDAFVILMMHTAANDHTVHCMVACQTTTIHDAVLLDYVYMAMVVDARQHAGAGYGGYHPIRQDRHTHLQHDGLLQGLHRRHLLWCRRH